MVRKTCHRLTFTISIRRFNDSTRRIASSDIANVTSGSAFTDLPPTTFPFGFSLSITRIVIRVIVSANLSGGKPAHACRNVNADIVGANVDANSGQTFTNSSPPTTRSLTTHRSKFSDAHNNESNSRFDAL